MKDYIVGGAIGLLLGLFIGYKINEVKHEDDDCITERPRGYIEINPQD